MVRGSKYHARSRTHGRGKKGGRGAGLRGGRGNAGLHKHKYIHCVKFMPDHFGRHGFKRPQRMIKEIITISFMEINERFEEFRTKGFVTEEDGAVLLDLKALKYDKLLSKGAPETPFSVKVDQISGGAREKIESMGGKVLSE